MISTSPIKISCVIAADASPTRSGAAQGVRARRGRDPSRGPDRAEQPRPRVAAARSMSGRRLQSRSPGRDRRGRLDHPRGARRARVPGVRGRPVRLRALGRQGDRVRRRRRSRCVPSTTRRSRASTSCSPRRAARSAPSGRRSFVEAGAVVVDNTSYWRMHDDVPLVVAGVNPEAAESHKGIVANPNCTTMVMMMALAPIHRAVGLERLVVSTYQAVSGTGQKAIEELRAQSKAVLAGERDPDAGGLPAPDRLQRAAPGRELQGRRRLHHRGAQGDGRDAQDPRLRRGGRDLRHLRPRAGLHRPLRVGQRADPRGPLARGLPRSCSPRPPAWRGRRPGDGVYPLAIDAAGRDEVLVGRIRRDPSHERCLNLWVVGDNLRKGAATNAVQVAELLVERGWLLNQR